MSNQDRVFESHKPAFDGATFNELAVSAHVAFASDECHDEFLEGLDHHHLAKTVPEPPRQLFQADNQPAKGVVVIDTGSGASDAQMCRDNKGRCQRLCTRKQSCANDAYERNDDDSILAFQRAAATLSTTLASWRSLQRS